MTLLLNGLLFVSPKWETDFEKAKESARADHKMILLNFSGSDWCGPCIRLHDEVFENSVFANYAGEHLVLVNADFPRLRKNHLTAEQQKKNDQLADKYDKDGIFPMTLLLSPDGKVLKKWEGYPKTSAVAFTEEIKALENANK